MARASEVLRIAAAEVGYCRWDDPQSGTRYGRWFAEYTGSSYYGANGVAFCAMFASWCFAQAGQACPGLPEAYVPYIYSKARKAGAVLASKRDARPGDLVLFDWGADGSLNHVGIVELNKGSYLQTIEGNTTGADGRSGSVARRTRSWGTVGYIVRPAWDGEEAPSNPDTSIGRIAVDGYWGRNTTLRAQEVAGTTPDGVVSRQNPDHRDIMPACTTGWEWGLGNGSGSPLIGALQAIWGVPEGERDCIMGPSSINYMIAYYMDRGSGASELDSKLDGPSITVKAFQRWLNEQA